jgi:hypothetical protein
MKRPVLLLSLGLGLLAPATASALPPVAPPVARPSTNGPGGSNPVTAGGRADAPRLSVLATGPAWKSYHVAGKLLDTDAQTLVAADEPIVVITKATGIASAPISEGLRRRLAAEVAAIPAGQSAGVIVVRKSIDDKVVAQSLLRSRPAEATCSDEDKSYTRQLAGSSPIHYPRSGESGHFRGQINVDGSASGNVNAQLQVRVVKGSVFGICFSYWAHFKKATFAGTGDVVAEAKVNGSFEDAWHTSTTVAEPTLYDDWISLAGFPIKLTVTLPVRAGVDASAKVDATFDGKVEVHGKFDVTCTSATCDGSKTASFTFVPMTPGKMNLNVKANVSPWAEAGVKLSLFDGIGSGELDVRATLSSDLWGYHGSSCGDADNNTAPEVVDAATLDSNLLVDLNAEASLLGAERKYSLNVARSHLVFLDLLGSSSAFAPIFYAQTAANGAATMRGRVRPCVPFGDKVHYEIDWTDGSPVEQFDDAPGTLFTRAHTFMPQAGRPGVATREFAPKLRVVSDFSGRRFGETTASPWLFRPTMAPPGGAPVGRPSVQLPSTNAPPNGAPIARPVLHAPPTSAQR